MITGSSSSGISGSIVESNVGPGAFMVLDGCPFRRRLLCDDQRGRHQITIVSKLRKCCSLVMVFITDTSTLLIRKHSRILAEVIFAAIKIG